MKIFESFEQATLEQLQRYSFVWHDMDGEDLKFQKTMAMDKEQIIAFLKHAILWSELPEKYVLTIEHSKQSEIYNHATEKFDNIDMLWAEVRIKY